MLCALCHLAAAPATNDPAVRVARWQEDLDYFASELPAREMDLFKLIPEGEFKREVAELKAEVPTLSDAEIVLRLTRLAARLGVAHALVKIGSATSIHALHLYPVTMRWFSDGLAIVATAQEYQRMLGTRVVRIGSMTPKQIETAVTPYIAHENDAHVHAESPRYMSMVELMQHEKIAGADGHLQLTCAKLDGQEFTMEIAPPGRGETRRKLADAADIPPASTALCCKHRKSLYWCEYLPDTQTLYLQFNSHHEEPGRPFKDFARELFAVADLYPVRRMVLDLRFNKGGHSEVAAPLEAGLRSRPALTAKGHLYVLIGWTTFSAGMDEAAYFRKHFHAILVGEPAGNKPNHYGSAESFKLPNSKLEVEYSTRYTRLIRDADPSSLDPDIPVPSRLNDFLAGRDPVLEAALHHPLQ